MVLRRRVVILLSAALLVGACGSSGDESAPSSLARREQAVKPVAALSGQVPEPAAARSIAYTAALRVSADDLDAASRQAQTVAERSGGFLFGQDSDLVGAQRVALVFKLPPEHFQQVLTGLSDLGRVLDRSVKADDMTDQVVDLEGRLATARTSVERLRGFVGQARNVGEVAGVEPSWPGASRRPRASRGVCAYCAATSSWRR